MVVVGILVFVEIRGGRVGRLDTPRRRRHEGGVWRQRGARLRAGFRHEFAAVCRVVELLLVGELVDSLKVRIIELQPVASPAATAGHADAGSIARLQ